MTSLLRVSGRPVHIGLATLDEAAAISALTTLLAEKFIAHAFSEEGARYLFRSLTPAAIGNALASGFRYHIARNDRQWLGVVGTRDNCHLYHLFVTEPAQGQGLGRSLWAVAKQACREAGHAGEFTVNASRFAVGFYQKLGFEPQGEEITSHGVIAVPMRLCERTASPSSRCSVC
ncbi:MAG: GNAT family N-acetyltransferase [Candidatus Competibacteraceae bacterium]